VRHRERTLSNSNPTIRALCVCEVTSLESYVLAFQTGSHNLLILLTQVHDWCRDKDINLPLPAPRTL